jgi:aminoglycoside/choline kinase family phosphotransferase
MADLPPAAKAFVSGHGWREASSTAIAGDASGRQFFRLSRGADTAVLMLAPDAGHRTGEFVTIAALLADAGLSAPDIVAADVTAGLVLMEDFGDRRVGALIDGGRDARPLLNEAVDLLLVLHERFDIAAPAAAGLPRFDPPRFQEQLNLLLDVCMAADGKAFDSDARSAFAPAWRMPLEQACAVPQSLLLRDFFADNLMLLPARDGVHRLGLLDFQDAGIGPVTYDLASLVDDARRDIDADTARTCLDRYVAARPDIDPAVFDLSVNVLAAMRHVRVIAVFRRLAAQGRTGYMQHLPRVSRLLERRLAHPALASVRDWFERYLPIA